MRSNTVDKLLKESPKDVEIFVDLYADLVVRINQILRDEGLTQNKLAKLLNKQPSEISKWLGGNHNFTLRSLAKLSAELEEPLLEVSKKIEITEFIHNGFVCRVHSTVSCSKLDYIPSECRWKKVNSSLNFNEISNVG